MTPELAELVGYFMGDGSLHAKGLRFCVASEDDDVVEHLVDLDRRALRARRDTSPRRRATPRSRSTRSRSCCGGRHAASRSCRPRPSTAARAGTRTSRTRSCTRTTARSTRRSSAACSRPTGRPTNGYVSWSTVTESFSRDVQTLLLALGFVTTRKVDDAGSNWGANDALRPAPAERLRRRALPRGDRLHLGPQGRVALERRPPPGRRGTTTSLSSRALVDELAPENDALRKTMLTGAGPPRRRLAPLGDRAARAHRRSELEHLLGFYYDTVATVETLDDQPTYDLSVPDNVTYVANGFVSHNTISFMMDCDTTGVEPDFSLVKSKKLVGGGEITIVNKTVPMALDEARLRADGGRGDRRLHRRAQHRRRRAVREGRALPDLRLRDRRPRDPLHRPREDDGRRPAVHLAARSRRP